MKRKDICVSEIANIIGISVAAISQQLKTLERAGLLVRERKGQSICYKINKKNKIARSMYKIINATK